MAIEDAPVVKVLKFDEAEAYNPDRSISGLIRTQLLHLHHAENLAVPAQFRTNINVNELLTERQASEYIHKVTQLLHSHGNLDNPRRSTKAKLTPAKVATKSAKQLQSPAKQTIKSKSKTQSSVQTVGRKQRKNTTRSKSKAR